MGERTTEQKHIFLHARLCRKMIGTRASDLDAENRIVLDPSLPHVESAKSQFTSPALTSWFGSFLKTEPMSRFALHPSAWHKAGLWRAVSWTNEHIHEMNKGILFRLGQLQMLSENALQTLFLEVEAFNS